MLRGWSREEYSEHIYVLELMAGMFAVQAFPKDMQGIHIHLRMDNTSAQSYVTRMGGTRSLKLTEVSCQMWNWNLQWLHSLAYCSPTHGDTSVSATVSGGGWMTSFPFHMTRCSDHHCSSFTVILSRITCWLSDFNCLRDSMIVPF